MNKRKKKCRQCREWYAPRTTLDRACSPGCALKLVRADRERARRKETKRAKEKIKTRRELTREAQVAFNKFIRARDADQPCICCGRRGGDESWKPGGEWDAGHYLSVGSHPELRFEELNCHKQLKSCNAGSGKFTRKNYTVGQEYRERLIAKIGQDAVEWLEGPHEQKKYTADDLREIRDYYRARTRELQ